MCWPHLRYLVKGGKRIRHGTKTWHCEFDKCSIAFLDMFILWQMTKHQYFQLFFNMFDKIIWQVADTMPRCFVKPFLFSFMWKERLFEKMNDIGNSSYNFYPLPSSVGKLLILMLKFYFLSIPCLFLFPSSCPFSFCEFMSSKSLFYPCPSFPC